VVLTAAVLLGWYKFSKKSRDIVQKALTVIAPYFEGLRTLPQTDVISAIGNDYGNLQGTHGLLFTASSPMNIESRKKQSESGSINEETNENRDVCSCCAKTLPR
jgi:hypothetical protein